MVLVKNSKAYQRAIAILASEPSLDLESIISKIFRVPLTRITADVHIFRAKIALIDKRFGDDE